MFTCLFRVCVCFNFLKGLIENLLCARSSVDTQVAAVSKTRHPSSLGTRGLCGRQIAIG